MSRADEAVKVGSALKSQLSRLSQLESDNKKLTEDNLYLRQTNKWIFSFIYLSIYYSWSSHEYTDHLCLSVILFVCLFVHMITQKSSNLVHGTTL